MVVNSVEQHVRDLMLQKDVDKLLPEDLKTSGALKNIEFLTTYRVDSLPPRSCFPANLTEEELKRNYSRDVDPWGAGMTALAKNECCWTCREFKVWSLVGMADTALAEMTAELEAAKSMLQRENPEMSNLMFSLSLDQAGEIEITSTGEKSFGRGINELKKLLKNSPTFQLNASRYAQSMLRLVDIFGSKQRAQEKFESMSPTAAHSRSVSMNTDPDNGGSARKNFLDLQV